MTGYLFTRRHPEYLKNEQIYRHCADAYQGGRSYMEKTLIRHISEIDVEFAERKRRAYYFNYPRSIARRITQYALAIPPARTGADPAMVEDWSRSGLRTNEVMRKLSTLLTVLYSENSDCIFFDEPELHLHPQFQLFFMTEIRKQIAKNPKKIFFLITHSPFFIDLKTPEELMGVIACHINRVPTHIEKLNDQDEKLFRKFLPRFNTYHKQFFFSDNQIFVEGYTDQQMFNQLLPFLANTKGISSTGIIDVGGKDELGVFCKVCSLLGTDGRIITDLDALFSGKLKDVVCQDKRPQEWINKQFQKQKSFYRMIFSQNELSGRITLKKLILKLETLLTEIGFEILKTQYPITPKIDLFVKKGRFLADKYDNLETLDTFKTVVLQGLCNIETIDMILLLGAQQRRAPKGERFA